MLKIKVNGEIFTASKGEMLSAVLAKNGIFVPHPCGGRGVCKKCTVNVDGKEVLSCQFVLDSDCTVTLPQYDEISQRVNTQEETAGEKLCLVLDIGTTTLALASVSLENGNIFKAITVSNPQVQFGADVMSRIEHCQKNGVLMLQKVLVSKINEMIVEFEIKEKTDLFVSGNTTMLHTLFGADCSAMGVAPYTPAFLDTQEKSGKELGLEKVNKVTSIPCISSFIGGDIVAGLLAAESPKENYNLLVDLGTNAEIVLFSRDKYICTSAAAGPCLEGATISCGMPATRGAICSFKEGKFETINGEEPKGICGSGLVDIITELVLAGVIDENGYMPVGSFKIAPGISITQQDVRQFQLAKSAIYSGIVSLLDEEKISFDKIEKCYISGGLSANINVDNGVKIGLLPLELKGKFEVLDNSSLLGTVKFALGDSRHKYITQNAKTLDLSTNTAFAKSFIEQMAFEIKE